MESLSIEEQNIIKDIRSIFKLKKELKYTAVKDIRNHFRQEKETKAIKDRILRDIKNLFEHEKEEENYYEPVRVSNFWSNNYIEYESNGDRNKTLSVEEYLNKIRPYLKDIINNLKKSDTWKIQLTIANNFISSIDNDEEHVMHSKSDNIEIMMNDKADEIIEELFDSRKNRYRNNLESMKGSRFVFVYVQLLYYKCHKINPNRGGSNRDSPDWIKHKKATINPVNKNGNKCFQYAITAVLNYEEIKKDPQRKIKLKPFIREYDWEGINFRSEKDDWKKYEKNNITIALNVLYAKNEKIYPAYI